MSEMEKIMELAATPGRKSYLFYGPPATGKTTYALKMFLDAMEKGKYRKLVIDVDEKVGEMEALIATFSPAVRAMIKVWQPQEPLTGDEIIIQKSPDPKEVKIGTVLKVDPRGMRRTVDLINELLATARKCAKDASPFPVDMVILDSWSRICDHAIRKVMYDHGVAFMSERLWGVLTQSLINTMSGFLQLPCDRVIIAHERHRTIRDRQTDAITREDIRPASIGQTSDTMGREFSEIYYFKGKSRSSGAYGIQTVNDRLLYARSSKGLADDCDINADGSLSPSKASR